MNREIYFIWFNSKDISLTKKRTLLKQFGSIEKLYNADAGEYLKTECLSKENINILTNKSLSFAEKESLRCRELGISLIPFGSKAFPPALYKISDPPLLLYAKGDVSLLQNRLAFCFVGSRECSDYGTMQTFKFASRIAEAGFTVVSGGAMGIDSAAHKAALVSHGKTIAVIGCGIDLDYPSGNKALRKEIAEKGLIISEYPLSTPAHKYNFPRRNRLLSGLSLGIAVMEAGAHSGALITAEYALQQNKDIYALPGNIDSICSAGCNNLIRQGAEMLISPEQVISEYLPRYPQLFPMADNCDGAATVKAVKVPVNNSNSDLSDAERTVIKLLKNGEQHIDYIISYLNLPVSRVTSLLTVMQLKGTIREEAGKYFKLNTREGY
ncbi:MAG: DNA-processing protein DprA [Clostridia bacterium]|nr:DNA-processing protein DprA [Clostridia bacterium]